MKKIIIFAFLCIFFLDSYRSVNSRDNVNLYGVYSGTIPAASAPGINVRLTLNRNNTFELQYIYIDRTDKIFINRGFFVVDDTGNIITLIGESFPQEMPPYYYAGEGFITQLDMQGQRITGDLADMYVLKKEIR